MIDIRDFKNTRIHFIGIGGCSMSGLALILKNLGYNVSGSDLRESDFTDMLRAHGVDVHIGHNAALVNGAGLVVYSAAIKPLNPEFAKAKELGLPMLERSAALGLISRDYKKVIGISGCHGKTTITSMLALITMDSAQDPTVHVGGMVDFLGGGVKLGKGDSFITEACEYVKSFLTLHPTHIVINNIDDDHLDFYRDIDDIIDTFKAFVSLLPEDGVLFANPDDANTRRVIETCTHRVITYSICGNGDYNAENVEFDERGNASFDIVFHGNNLGRIRLGVMGMHNVQNALAACTAAMNVYGISMEECAAALADYRLAGRRFELMGERDGVKVFHDYAHHPSEIKACLAAAKRFPHKKMWVVFQCNSFTRARTLKDKYALAFDDADEVLVPDLYPGRDVDTGDIHATDLVKVIDAHSHNCKYIASFEAIRGYLLPRWEEGDIVITLGSGDVNKQTMKLFE